MRRSRRRVSVNGRKATAQGTPEDVDVLEDLCGTIKPPITILSIDQAGNNIRNLNRLLSVLHDFPRISGKARSDLHLLGLVDAGEITEIGERARRCRTTTALARTWCHWLKTQTRRELADINPALANFKRCANIFWTLRAEVITFFFANLNNRRERATLNAIELLCNGDKAVRELTIEDFRSFAPFLLDPKALPAPLRRAIRSYHTNKGNRSWRGNERRILLEAYRRA